MGRLAQAGAAGVPIFHPATSRSDDRDGHGSQPGKVFRRRRSDGRLRCCRRSRYGYMKIRKSVTQINAIGTRHSVAADQMLLADEARGVGVRTTAEELTKQLDLALRRSRPSYSLPARRTSQNRRGETILSAPTAARRSNAGSPVTNKSAWPACASPSTSASATSTLKHQRRLLAALRARQPVSPKGLSAPAYRHSMSPPTVAT